MFHGVTFCGPPGTLLNILYVQDTATTRSYTYF